MNVVALREVKSVNEPLPTFHCRSYAVTSELPLDGAVSAVQEIVVDVSEYETTVGSAI